MKKIITVLCLSFTFLCFVSVNATAQKKPVPLEGDALVNWLVSTMKKNSVFPEKSKYPAYELPTIKMALSRWGYEDRSARVKLSVTVKDIQRGKELVLLDITSAGLEDRYFGGIDNFTGIEAGDFLNIYVNYVLESKSDWVAYSGFVEMCDVLDKPNAQEWVYNNVTYKKNTLQEALRITRNEGKSGKKYNFWTRDIDYIFAAGYFMIKTGTTELALVEYYGEDLESRSGHGGVLYNIDCTGITPKVTAIKFFEYPSRR